MLEYSVEDLYVKLKETPLFRYFESRDLVSLIKASTVIVCKEGDTIIKEHELNPNFFILISGSVNVTVAEQDKDVFICAIGEGEVFGEAGLFGKVKRTASVSAAVDSILLKFAREEFLRFIRGNPSTGIKLLMIIVYSLLKKLRGVNQELAYERKFDIEQDDIDSIIKGIMIGE